MNFSKSKLQDKSQIPKKYKKKQITKKLTPSTNDTMQNNPPHPTLFIYLFINKPNKTTKAAKPTPTYIKIIKRLKGG